MLTIALNLKSLLCVDYNAAKNVVVEGSNFIFKLHGMQRGLASSPGHTRILLQRWRETIVKCGYGLGTRLKEAIVSRWVGCNLTLEELM